MSRILRGPVTGIGFHSPRRSLRPLAPRKVAFTQLIMTASLIVSIAVAATAVSIGIARAGVPVDLAAKGRDSVSAIAVILSMLIVLMGVITAAITLHPDETTQHD